MNQNINKGILMENVIVILLVVCILLVAIVYLYARDNKEARAEVAALEARDVESFKKLMDATTNLNGATEKISSIKEHCIALEDKISEHFTRFTTEIGTLKKQVDQYRDEALMTRKSNLKDNRVKSIVKQMPKTIEVDTYPEKVLSNKKKVKR